jgi:Transglycosylase SLT domain
MDLLSILLACNLYTADEPLVRAIADSNSHGNPFAVVDPSMDYRQVEVPPDPKTLEAAVARLDELRGKGGKPLLGLMQVPAEWMKSFGREPRDAFDACINVSVGTAMLSALAHECALEKGPRVERVAHHGRRLPVTVVLPPERACVVRKYGQAIGMPDFELLITLELGGQRPAQASRPPVDAPIIFPESGARSWGPDCIFATLAPVDPMTGLGSLSAPPALGAASAGDRGRTP